MRVFISHLDTVPSRTLTHVFSQFGWEVYGNILDIDCPPAPITATQVFPRPSEDMEEFRRGILSCSVVIYDVEIPEDATTACEICAASPTERVFLLLSTLLTWARSPLLPKPEPEPLEEPEWSEAEEDEEKEGEEEEEEPEEEEPEEEEEEEEEEEPYGVDEQDYQGRRPHANYRSHLTCERAVARRIRFSPHISGNVINAGVIYGRGETGFFPLFKAAFEGARLPLYGSDHGRVIPTIHALDLAVLCHALATDPAESVYVFAVDKTLHTARQITEAIAQTALPDPAQERFAIEREEKRLKRLGKPKTKKQWARFKASPPAPRPLPEYVAEIPPEEYLLMEGIEALRLDLPVVPGAAQALELAPLSTSFVGCVDMVMQEFLDAWRLSGPRVLVEGRPGSGKTTLGKAVADRYKVPLLTPLSILDRARACATVVERHQELLAQEDGAVLESPEWPSIVRSTLLYDVSLRVQGYVLDTMPVQADQVTTLFERIPLPTLAKKKPEGEEEEEEEPEEEEEEEEEEDELPEDDELDPADLVPRIRRRLLRPSCGPALTLRGRLGVTNARAKPAKVVDLLPATCFQHPLGPRVPVPSVLAEAGAGVSTNALLARLSEVADPAQPDPSLGERRAEVEAAMPGYNDRDMAWRGVLAKEEERLEAIAKAKAEAEAEDEPEEEEDEEGKAKAKAPEPEPEEPSLSDSVKPCTVLRYLTLMFGDSGCSLVPFGHPAFEAGINACPSLAEYKGMTPEAEMGLVQVVAGPARGFQPTKAEVRAEAEAEREREEAEARAKEEARVAAVEAAAEARRLVVALTAEREAEAEAEAKKRLESLSVPYRQYLQQTVMSAVSDGLSQLGRIRPADPIDWLGEFLMRRAVPDL
ncbi:adenylate kinase/UMP-CMP kinase [Kipferlia bialata]|uniref:Adenylate kinase/UMP-CMP kinase n=1 Tax=Kipferlia bialata TaxID=797122 RepID=A0A9K3GM18_9EUKA|nr:adenylate kinase/UMP-CMP kinase [Kipferlia bialata]|eukprot:g10035.t1